MADSGITKRALGAAMKALMSERPFSKISIGDICKMCEMNRKSFYYHFRDKYDLVNRIFDTEFASSADTKNRCVWEAFDELCVYLYNNKEFYREALGIEGQNSFSEHFTEYCGRAFTKRLQSTYVNAEMAEFQAKLLADSLKNALERWLCAKDCLPPEKFSAMFKSCIHQTAAKICEKMDTVI